MGLSRLAALHGVATSFSPSTDVTVPVPEGTVVAVLAALGVDATTPEAVREALAAAESAARSRLLPATLVVWAGEPLPPALTALPPGTELTVHPEEPAGAPPPRCAFPPGVRFRPNPARPTPGPRRTPQRPPRTRPRPAGGPSRRRGCTG